MYEISLNINGQVNKFVRNGEPGLGDTTAALKVQQQQLRMYAREDGPTNADFDANEANLANFAVNFWNGQFSRVDVIAGATKSLKSLDSINKAIADALDDGEESEEPAKKSQTRTSKKRSTTSTTSTKPDLQTVTN